MNLLNRIKTVLKLLSGDKTVSRIVKRAKSIKKHKLLQEMKPSLHCSNISLERYSFAMGGTMGTFNPENKVISINQQASNGILLVDTLFHEDRHSQQYASEQSNIVANNIANYIPSNVSMSEYYTQHLEKDARRYAYIRTCKFVKARKMNFIKRFISLSIYKYLMHPFTGKVHKRYTK